MAQNTTTSMPRPGWRRLWDRIQARADEMTATADAEAAAAGLTVREVSRHRRVYTDPRVEQLRAARAAGCSHVPVHLDLADCPQISITSTRKAVA